MVKVQDFVRGADAETEHYRLIAETIPHLVWGGRADGELDFFNRRCLEFTGLSFEQLQGSAWKSVIHPDDLQRCVQTWTHALRTGEPYDIEYRLRRHDGRYLWHVGSARPLRNSRGTIVRWFGTCTDIDEPTRALRESEARFRSLLELSTDWYWEQDAEFRFTVITGPSIEVRRSKATASANCAGTSASPT
jgi:PAS domain S-box-containing protein